MSVTSEELKQLSAEFPQEDIHWRAQTLTKNGDKALALAYLDARDVMDRLDQICGMENWQDRYEVHGTKTICYISIKINDEWVVKSDGAGDTKVEAEKGSISDAFKRAAVKWGIGRYLYSLGSPWCPCETYERNGKKVFSKFTVNPWNEIKKKPVSKAKIRDEYSSLINEMASKESIDALGDWVKSISIKARYATLEHELKQAFKDELANQKKSLIEGDPSRLIGA